MECKKDIKTNKRLRKTKEKQNCAKERKKVWQYYFYIQKREEKGLKGLTGDEWKEVIGGICKQKIGQFLESVSNL